MLSLQVVLPPGCIACCRYRYLCHSDVILSCDVMVTYKLSDYFIARPGFIWEKFRGHDDQYQSVGRRSM